MYVYQSLSHSMDFSELLIQVFMSFISLLCFACSCGYLFAFGFCFAMSSDSPLHRLFEESELSLCIFACVLVYISLLSIAFPYAV